MNAAPMAAAARIGAQAEPGIDAADAMPSRRRPRPRSNTESRNAPSRLTCSGRPGERAVEQVEDAADDHDDAGDQPALGAASDRGDDRDPEPEQRQGVRREAEPPEGEGDRLAEPRTRVRVSGLTSEPLTSGLAPLRGALVGGRCGRAWQAEAEQGPLRASASSNASGRRRQNVSRPLRRVSRARGPQPADVPADEGLGQPDLLDELGDGRLAARQAPDDPEPVDVGEGA